MPLIKCPDCGTDVSDRAPTCPRCGAPISGRADAVAVGAAVTTVQETSKRLKAQIVLAALCFWAGVVLTAVRSGPDNMNSPVVPILLATFGLVWYLATKARIWWYHK